MRRSRPFLESFIEGLKDPEEAAAYIDAAKEDSEEAYQKAILEVAMARENGKVLH